MASSSWVEISDLHVPTSDLDIIYGGLTHVVLERIVELC